MCPTYLLKYKKNIFYAMHFSTMNWHFHLENIHLIATYLIPNKKTQKPTKQNKVIPKPQIPKSNKKAFLINYLLASWTSTCPSTPQEKILMFWMIALFIYFLLDDSVQGKWDIPSPSTFKTQKKKLKNAYFSLNQIHISRGRIFPRLASFWALRC